MIIAFAVENHLSIRERQVLNLEATTDDHLAESRVLDADGLKLLRSVAIYGPNASGKSNLLEAMMTMRQLVLAAPPSSEEQEIPAEPFRLSVKTAKEASVFECTFLLDGMRFRYGFAVDKHAVQEEWLMRQRIGHKEARLFTREGQNIDVNSEQFREGVERRQFALKNTFFLSLCAQLNGEIAGKIVNWFRRLRFVTGLSDTGYFHFTAKRLQEPKAQRQLVDFAKRADLSICGLTSKMADTKDIVLPDSLPEQERTRLAQEVLMANTEIKTRHTLFDDDGKEQGTVEFDLKKDESEGTRKFIALSGPLHHTVEEGAVLVVDEFEARLHPLLTQQIIEWFHSPLNLGRAQLIFATHDVLLMEPERIRRDQVWFCEKDNHGATDLYCLAEFKPQQVRPTTKFSRQYMLGLFGGIPKLALMKGDPIRG